MHPCLSTFAFLTSLLLSASNSGAEVRPPAENSSELDALLHAASLPEVFAHPAWLHVGHWRKTALGGYESEQDSSSFFLSTRGRTDPRAELQATLRAFHAPLAPDEVADYHPRCHYPARELVLRSLLRLDPDRLPQVSCRHYQRWREKLDVNRLELVFASYYFGNPSSMFGHTLLKLRRGPKQPDLTDQSVNFSANTGDAGTVWYFVGGIFGGFTGTFSLLPYFARVFEYNHLEQRDLWEYPLALTPLQLDLVLGHLWELGEGTWFDYFFFTENCSYHLLGLVETAVPGQGLTESFGLWTVPIDTIKVLQRRTDVVGKPHWRPSLRRRFEHQLALLHTPERAMLPELLAPDRVLPLTALAALPPERRVPLLDAALEYLTYDHGRSLQAQRPLPELEALRERLRQLGHFRAELPAAASSAPPTPSSTPEQLHETSRLALSTGSQHSAPFLGLLLRPSFHDLLARPAGFDPHAQFIGGETEVRVFPQQSSLMLRRLDLLSLYSLQPMSEYFLFPSHLVELGIAGRGPLTDLSAHELHLRWGRGGALALLPGGGATAYLMPGFTVRADPRDRWALRGGIGTHAGLLLGLPRHSRLLASTRYHWVPWSHHRHDAELSLGGNVPVTTNTELRLHATWSTFVGLEGILSGAWYF
ncbi:MAG: hypothetical protein A2284_04220 [Deltaproteobacteria bacterium RIFOXYA12_FULL_61_11]|nr:MAG: hypothetical protein A2284_04220 [Deltaproteobacteria bacterium RIFOXYA12_FULL_61_11]